MDIPTVPVAVTVFPEEIYRAPRSWGERAFGNLIYWNEVDKGAATSRRGSSRNSWLRRSERRSDHCASWREGEYGHNLCPYSPATRGNIDLNPIGERLEGGKCPKKS